MLSPEHSSTPNLKLNSLIAYINSFLLFDNPDRLLPRISDKFIILITCAYLLQIKYIHSLLYF